jgi:diguanylate cyclase (GGDEF)-like protein/PAS domain S-box-containing protein
MIGKVRAPLPANESLRLAALRRYAVLDSGPEDAFDRLTALAARIFQVPIALVSLVDANRQWFKSCVGLSDRETHRDAAFCSHAVAADAALVIQDARDDPRFVDNPLVIGSPYIRFYAGAPLRTPDGLVLGTFCIIDSKPRVLLEEERQRLIAFAATAMDELELRHATLKLAEQKAQLEDALMDAERNRRLFERIAHSSPDLIYLYDLIGRHVVYANRDAIVVLGYTQEQFQEFGESLIPAIIHPDDLKPVLRHFLAFEKMDDEGRIEFTCRVRDGSGAYRWFQARENVFTRTDAGEPREILGVASDVTSLKVAEERLALLATTDEMTRIPNHRSFRERLTQLVAEGERKRSFALAMVDVDHFKRLNDMHGHQVGDEVLKAVAGGLAGNIRVVDHVARYGGEEFAVLFVDVDEAAAVMLADRLRRVIAEIRGPVAVTASFGVCGYRPGLGSEALVSRADAALYRAKEEGRNRVVAAAQVAAESAPRTRVAR